VNAIRAVIFDLDGTLIDSKYDLSTSVNYVRSLFSKPPLEVSTIVRYVGDGVRPLIERALTGVTPASLEKSVKDFSEHYALHLLDTTKLFPGILESLKALSAAGKKNVILTNKPEALTRRIAAGLGIEKYFDIIWGGDTGALKKPDPEPVLKVLELAKTPAGAALMIGDGANDILAAQRAGVKSVAACWGYTQKPELLALRPDLIADTPYELSDILRRLNVFS
jgi:phosphoglycolate phosphatase